MEPLRPNPKLKTKLKSLFGFFFVVVVFLSLEVRNSKSIFVDHFLALKLNSDYKSYLII